MASMGEPAVIFRPHNEEGKRTYNNYAALLIQKDPVLFWRCIVNNSLFLFYERNAFSFDCKMHSDNRWIM